MNFKEIKDFQFDKDKKTSLQIKAVKGLAVFLVLMFLLTVISRAADSLTIAKVNVTSSSSMAIQHKIEADGMIASNKDIAISAAPGVKIASVEVQEGHLVKKDDLMIQLDMDDLQKKLLEAQKELKILEATASDKAANEAIAAQEDQKTKSRAYEDYDQTMRDAADAVRNAKKAMNEALAAYNAAKNSGSESTDDTTVHDQLEKNQSEKTTALSEAQDDLTALKTTIIQEKERKVIESVDQRIAELIEEEVQKEMETRSPEDSRTEEEIRQAATDMVEAQRDAITNELKPAVEAEVDNTGAFNFSADNRQFVPNGGFHFGH